MNIMSMDTTRL